MLVGITGTCGSGRRTAVEYFEKLRFSRLENTEDALESVVSRWREHFVVLIGDEEPSPEISKRPWFVHIHIEAPEVLRRSRAQSEFIEESAPLLRAKLRNSRAAHICIVNAYETKNEFWDKLGELNVLDTERVRPSWDRYFMTIADLAAQRSNCMKRRVGCVLVYENRIVATGYNGTPRGCLNCNEGGCERCNSGSQRGSSLSTCLCLHAEENALLEAGRLRVANSILYCNTCPCLTCSIKIVQTGVREVVYSQEYSMDGESARVLQNGGVQLRKYGA